MHCSNDAWSGLQLPLQLIEEAPVSTLRDDPVGARSDHAGFAQPQRIESDRVLDVVQPPLRVRDFPERLERIVIAGGESCSDDPLRDLLRLANAKIGGSDDCAQKALGRD